MKVLLTGASGFLGWHTRLRLRAQGDHAIVPVTRANWAVLPNLMRNIDAVMHLAGVNRADDPEDVRSGNVALAEDLSEALAEVPGVRVVYANSTQAGNGSSYGTGKAAAREILNQAAHRNNGSFVDVRLPNVFGEHGRPRYNSFVATFVDAIVRGDKPTIHDGQVLLVHAQDAAQALINALTTTGTLLDPAAQLHRVRDVWELLAEFDESYRHGEFPDLSTKFRIDLFNTYRSALFPERYPLVLTRHTDPRGMFVETVRSRGGEGQSSISTTAPGITRGEHFHLNKIERFAVVQGEATIGLRKMFTHEIVEFHVSGEQPTAIDMPIGWAHNVTNTGEATLLTQFWSHELFRPDSPDTYAELVCKAANQERTA